MTALEPVRKWDHLYCAVKACGYPLTPYPPEASQGWCTACGHSYEYVNVIEEGTRLASKSQHDGLVLKKDTAELSKGFPFALEDPSVRSGVEWLQKAASGESGKESKIIMDTILEFCHQCKARTPCTYYSKQTRGADEGQTQFYTCTKCEDTWMAHS